MQEPLSLPPAETKRQHKKIFVALVLAFCVLFFWQYAGSHVKSTIAQVEGNVYPVLAPFSGVVEQVLVKNGDFVEKGQALFIYDTGPLKQALDEALAGLNLAAQGRTAPTSQDPNLKQADIQAAEALRLAQNQEKAAAEKLSFYVAEHSRSLVALRNPQAADKAALANLEQEARQHVEAAREESAKATQTRIHAENSYAHIHESLKRPAQENSLAQVELWQSRVTEAQNRLYAATVVAPLAGIVQGFNTGRGDTLAGDEPLGLISPLLQPTDNQGYTASQEGKLPGLWVRAAFDARTFPQIKTGQKVLVRLDSGVELGGNIVSLAPLGDGSGEARVQVEDVQKGTLLYPGQAAEVTVRAR